MLVDDELEGKRTKLEAEIQIDSPDHIGSYKDQEILTIKSKIQHIIDSGANVIISRKGINTLAQHMLTQAGIIIIIIIIVTIVIITMTVISTRALRILMRRIFAIIMETLTSNLVMQNVSMRNL
jgi:hypothetical protein